MIYNIQCFGCAGNFSGQTGERALKNIVKDHAQQTQQRVNVFASQCADCEL
jgi:spore coat protein CotF